MSDHILTLNAGSSSIKFSLYAPTGTKQDPGLRLAGQVENIGGAPRLRGKSSEGDRFERDLPGDKASDHQGALHAILDLVDERFPGISVPCVGHRVVHGGVAFTEPAILDDGVKAELERLVPFAPLHQPHNLAGVAAATEAFPDALQIACFDTSFHRNHPFVDDVFALPRKYYDQGVRRYGFHGLSYDYVSGRLAETAPLLHAGRVVVAHLGNGASMCAMLGGCSVGSTMGFSALDGLPMGSRCGQLDPGVVLYLMDHEGMNAEEISDLLYRQSGLLGLSSLSNDMRTLRAADTKEAGQAIDYFVFRIRRELGALAAVLGGLDAVVFTGGIGENAHPIRARVCEGMAWIGIELDHAANEDNAGVISTPLSRARVMVVPTNEELVIARAALRFLVTPTVASIPTIRSVHR